MYLDKYINNLVSIINKYFSILKCIIQENVPPSITSPDIDEFIDSILIGSTVIIFLILKILKQNLDLKLKKGETYTINIIAYSYKNTALREVHSLYWYVINIFPKCIIITEEDTTGTAVCILFGKENWCLYNYTIWFLENKLHCWTDFLISKY